MIQILKNTAGIIMWLVICSVIATVVSAVVGFLMTLMIHFAMWEPIWWDVVWEVVVNLVRFMLIIMWFFFMILVGVAAVNHEMDGFGESWTNVMKWINKW